MFEFYTTFNSKMAVIVISEYSVAFTHRLVILVKNISVAFLLTVEATKFTNFWSPSFSFYFSFIVFFSENVTLFVDIKTPDCVYPVQQLVVSWSTKDPRFCFLVNDAWKRYSAIFTIEPYSTPVEEKTFITATAFVGLFQNQSTEAVVELKAQTTSLKAGLMDGVQKITVGSQSGTLKLFSVWQETKVAGRGKRIDFFPLFSLKQKNESFTK